MLSQGATTGRFGYSACVVLAGICWGLTGLCNRFITPAGFTQTQIMFMRGFIPLILLALYMLVFNRAAFKIKLKDLWCFLGSGLLSLTMFGVAYMSAMQEMSLSMAVVLLYTSPIFVILLSAPLFKERITLTKVIALVLVILGAVCTTGVILGSLTITAKGLLYDIISGLGYALYSIFSRFAFQRGYKPLTVTFYTFLFSVIALAFICDPGEIPGLITTPGIAGWIVALGIVTCLIPYLLYTKGLEGIENGTASILATIEMVVATLVSALFFQEPFGLTNLIGIALVFVGIVIMNVRVPRKDPSKIGE
ncbi:MAG: EamA family transporter [Eggerthellaceae bacterium]|nr:EamA family transporter [Eggerthellaceae bacterium]